MKYLGLISIIFLAGCQSIPSFCESEPDSNLCNQKTYQYNTDQALEEFASRKSNKAFALGQTSDGSEFYGYGEGYSSTYKAKAAALEACQTRLDKHGVEGKCELIR
ncbi:hypothetical protein [Colwellia psychrerythraea]|uniref:Putative lipoprotein n=1 Tax=Colwellia psychrerythraea (strain 34H / ATCC BAA-681) TaxID=167879 RepID=Q481L2_COLP3|nr:hypothetical protein [Colwellia psychrerythraea]AAZ27029.1 putative lipoprotein [Colwellia psychrerythraea 34H]